MSVVLGQDRDQPGLCRVILKQHVKEMTHLSTQQRARLMRAVFAVESALRELRRGLTCCTGPASAGCAPSRTA
jgi:diadenosine tetraphosphate (Ap4A) HIT family hydrolase